MAHASSTVQGRATCRSPVVFPIVIPDCMLHVQPSYLDELLLTTQSNASIQFAIPNDTVLGGIELWHQMVPLQVTG